MGSWNGLDENREQSRGQIGGSSLESEFPQVQGHDTRDIPKHKKHTIHQGNCQYQIKWRVLWDI